MYKLLSHLGSRHLKLEIHSSIKVQVRINNLVFIVDDTAMALNTMIIVWMQWWWRQVMTAATGDVIVIPFGIVRTVAVGTAASLLIRIPDGIGIAPLR